MAHSDEASVAFDATTVVVITGCSRGLGFNLAKGILETTESTVVATARNVDKATALLDLDKKFSGRLQLVDLDTASETSIKAAAAEVEKRHGGIDLLFNVAGIDEGVDKCCLDVTGAEYDMILKVNVLGPFLTTVHFLPLLRKKQSRVVVNMSSSLGSISQNRLGITDPDKNPIANRWVAYNSSKAALNMQTEVLANELKDEGFCLVALSPGWVNTDMGGTNARKLGMKAAPLDIDTSIRAQIKLLKGLTAKNTGEFVGHEGEHIDW